MGKSKMKRNHKKDTIEIGGWETEIEAAQAYNIMTLIFNGEGGPFNDVPTPPMSVYDKVMLELKRKGWRASQQDMYVLKNLLKIHFGMDFKTDS
jgi:hypothetical protein